MNGALIVDKPAGPSSHDVVALARRAIGVKRIGHTGTLDPLATGVLVLLVGRATRLAQFLNADDKEYIAGVRLGLETESGDAETRAVMSADTPLAVDCSAADVEDALADFRGTYWQTPPAVSAKKIAGTRAYVLARRHERVELKPVEVTVRELELLSYASGLAGMRVVCSAGFYVRALARDLGRRLGCGAHLETLRRTRAGRFGLDGAVTLDALVAEQTRAVERLLPMHAILADMPAVTLTEQETQRAAHGNALARGTSHAAVDEGEPEGSRVQLLDATGTVVAIAERRAGGLLHPVVVLV